MRFYHYKKLDDRIKQSLLFQTANFPETFPRKTQVSRNVHKIIGGTSSNFHAKIVYYI